MTQCHGKDTVVLLGSRNATADLTAISVEGSADVHDTTTMGDDWKEFSSGLIGWSGSFEAFYDNAAGGIAVQTASLLGASVVALSIFDGDGDAIGDKGIILGPGILTGRAQPVTVADMTKITGTIQGSGRAGLYGVLLHPLGDETGTGDETSHDGGAASAAGGRANLHVTAITGSWTIKVQHSVDDIVWADLVTFTQATEAGGITSESKEVTGAVRQYLRVSSTEDVAGTITFACGLARY